MGFSTACLWLSFSCCACLRLDAASTGTQHESTSFLATKHGDAHNIPTVYHAKVPNPHSGRHVKVTHEGYHLDRIIFGVMFFAFFGSMGYTIYKLAWKYQELRRPGMPTFKKKGFKEFLEYRFAYWFEWTAGAHGQIISFLAITVVLVGAVAYSVGVGADMFTSTFKVFAWLVAPDAGVSEKDWHGAMLGAFLSVCGLVIFALLLMLLQDSFTEYLSELKEGQAPVMESGHIVLIGVSAETLGIVEELCDAFESMGGTAIVILTDVYTKYEMENKLKKLQIEKRGTRIVVRHGKPSDDHDLKHVAAHTAATVVVLPHRQHGKEVRDSYVMTTLVTLRSNGWPAKGRILAVCSLVLNKKLFEQLGGDVTDVLMIDSFMARLLVQASMESGLGQVTSQILGFGDSEMYIRTAPKQLVGRSFQEAEQFYETGVLTGMITKNESGEEDWHLCPDRTYVLKPEDHVVVLAEDFAGSGANLEPLHFDMASGGMDLAPCMSSRSSSRLGAPASEVILILGWNELVGIMMLSLDAIVGPNSHVMLVSPKDPKQRDVLVERTKHRWDKEFKNITKIQQIKGEIGSRYVLNDLTVPLQDCSRVFILADDSAASDEFADMATIAVMLQIRRLLALRHTPRDIPIVPELRVARFEETCARIHAPDFINSAGVPSQVLAMIAYDPRIGGILDVLLGPTGACFAVRELKTYTRQRPEELSFVELGRLVREHGDLLVGWSRLVEPEAEGEALIFHGTMSKVLKDAHPSSLCVHWEMNPPDKTGLRQWCEDDRIVVLTDDGSEDPLKHQHH